MSWTSPTGSAITWKYPSVIFGHHSVGEFFSVVCSMGFSKQDTGIQNDPYRKNTRVLRSSQRISAGKAKTATEGWLAHHAEGQKSLPSVTVNWRSMRRNTPSHISKSEIHPLMLSTKGNISNGEDQLFYCVQRGISEDNAISMIVNGFCSTYFQNYHLNSLLKPRSFYQSASSIVCDKHVRN